MTPLSHVINNSILKGVFPSQAQIIVFVLSYKPVITLTTVFQIYEQLIKNYLTSSMNVFKSCLSAFRTSYSTQHSLIRRLEKKSRQY